jgi:hypothetical protein
VEGEFDGPSVPGLIEARNFKDHVPLSAKLDQILAWVDLPLEKRPQLLMGRSQHPLPSDPLLILWSAAYEPSLDQAGHATGPMSALVNVRFNPIHVTFLLIPYVENAGRS